jgi:hypothetical protein
VTPLCLLAPGITDSRIVQFTLGLGFVLFKQIELQLKYMKISWILGAAHSGCTFGWRHFQFGISKQEMNYFISRKVCFLTLFPLYLTANRCTETGLKWVLFSDSIMQKTVSVSELETNLVPCFWNELFPFSVHFGTIESPKIYHRARARYSSECSHSISLTLQT